MYIINQKKFSHSTVFKLLSQVERSVKSVIVLKFIISDRVDLCVYPLLAPKNIATPPDLMI
jgi:hypothetical protein